MCDIFPFCTNGSILYTLHLHLSPLIMSQECFHIQYKKSCFILSIAIKYSSLCKCESCGSFLFT